MKNSELLTFHLDYHRRVSRDNNYIQDGMMSFLPYMKHFDGVWPAEETGAHIVHFIKQRLKDRLKANETDRFVALDIGAAHNNLLRELALSDPRIISLGIALADQRTRNEKELDQRRQVGYSAMPVEKMIGLLRDLDLVFCFGTAQHLAEPLTVLHDIYQATSLGAEIYFEWDGRGQTSQVEWLNGTYVDFLAELKARGLQCMYVKRGTRYFLMIKKNEQPFPTDFYHLAGGHQPSEFRVASDSAGVPAIKSTIVLEREKMSQPR